MEFYLKSGDVSSDVRMAVSHVDNISERESLYKRTGRESKNIKTPKE